uniref:Uncharacterized protein n=1 Tax=Rhizophora mucronata TaxID=61149 RepID=A0A2P2QDB2_RHIMU
MEESNVPTCRHELVATMHVKVQKLFLIHATS